MIAYLDSVLSIHSLIWLFLAAFMLHDFEEIIRIEPWYRKHRERIFSKILPKMHAAIEPLSRMTSSQFAVAVCLEFIVFIPVTYLAAEQGIYLMFLAFNAIMLLHVFMHIGQALFLKMLVPGVVTAVLITLPYSLYLFYRLLNEQMIQFQDILLSLPFGLLLAPLVWLGHIAGEKLVPSANAIQK